MNDQNAFSLGVVEGFYGVFYTFPERIDLIRFIGKHGYTRYLYAPKNDRQHRARWWEPYPAPILRQFAETVEAARESGVRFAYGISPGGSIRYHSAEDFAHLTSKLRAFFDLGVRDFSLLLDDNEPGEYCGFRCPEDAACFPDLPAAQAELANRLFAWLQTLDRACTLIFVPAEYTGPCDAELPSALNQLAGRLHPQIELCYTGCEICSPEITAEDARAFTKATGRKPLIWDNYPVNDLSMHGELHLAPISGRGADLLPEVTGILINPMIQAEASKIPLATYAVYIADPRHYEPAAAFQRALIEVAGKEQAYALRTLAEQANLSCLSLGRAVQPLAGLPAALVDLRYARFDSPAVRVLEDHLTEIDEACYALKFRLDNLALRNNLLPWIELLEHWLWLARFSLKALKGMVYHQPWQNDLNRAREYRQLIQNHPKRILDPGLLPLLELAESFAAELSALAAAKVSADTKVPGDTASSEANASYRPASKVRQANLRLIHPAPAPSPAAD